MLDVIELDMQLNARLELYRLTHFCSSPHLKVVGLLLLALAIWIHLVGFEVLAGVTCSQMNCTEQTFRKKQDSEQHWLSQQR